MFLSYCYEPRCFYIQQQVERSIRLYSAYRVKQLTLLLEETITTGRFFFFCATDKRQLKTPPDNPPALHCTPHVGEM
jgi:hypothetical protein